MTVGKCIKFIVRLVSLMILGSSSFVAFWYAWNDMFVAFVTAVVLVAINCLASEI